MVSKKPYSENNSAKLVRNGQEFIDACVEAIKSAKEKLLFHTYIFEEDEITLPVIEELEKKAKSGIKVFIIFDAFGTPDLSHGLKKRLDQAGIKRAWFAPLFGGRWEHLGRRLHQKVLVIDNEKAICGGINLGKKFILPASSKPWLDYAVELEGEEVYHLQKKTFRLYARHFPEEKKWLKASIKKTKPNVSHPVKARTLVNDFMRFKTEIYQSYIEAISKARSSIKMTATYFLPGKKLLRELKKASKRGVKIELIFGSRSDHPWERWPSKYLYSWYLNHDLKIYEWSESILHAKAALIDDQWVSIGSYNHNYLSRYICVEMNIEVRDVAFGKVMNEEFERIKSHCVEISSDTWKTKARWYHSLLYFLTYSFSNLVTFLTLLFVFRKKDKGDAAQ